MERFGSKSTVRVKDKIYTIYRIKKLEEEGIADISRLPFSIRVLVENLLRNMNGKTITKEDVKEIANWKNKYEKPREIAFYPARVILQDFTGVPGIVDMAAMRDVMVELGKNPEKINPLVPVDLVIDHSIQVDYYGSSDALEKNMALEYKRNKERYTLLKWAQNAFETLRIFPPGMGIIHQVNLEYIARVVMTSGVRGEIVAFPDTLIGTDSHTTMINGLGVLGWGVGGIEAEAVMLGQPYYMTIPEVIGVRLSGELPEGVTATDLVLTITELLRKHKVVGKFVEYFGTGAKRLPLPDRATLANMAPEYGATTGFFPVDEETINYLNLTNRCDIACLVETYAKKQGLFYHGDEEPEYSNVVELDMSAIVPSLAGPSRPQDRIPLRDMKKKFVEFIGSEQQYEVNSRSLSIFGDESGHEGHNSTCKIETVKKEIKINLDGQEMAITDGSVVIAAITSCTNTSNPSLIIGAGILAKKAVEKGLRVEPYVKTSLAPGSRVVQEYLQKSGLLHSLEMLKFHTTGFGCTTCIGNSGQLRPEIENAIRESDLNVSAVISGNRNFEARIHHSIKSNYLTSPILVVAYALAGRIDIDLTTEPLGLGKDGRPVYLKDIWPSSHEIKEMIDSLLTPEIFAEIYRHVFEGDRHWQLLPSLTGDVFQWDEESTYIRRPSFFERFKLVPDKPTDIEKARVLLVLGDSVTTDHISPAGAILEDCPAGKYLIEHGVESKDFNTYGSRRGNHEVMMCGTFANLRIKNKLITPKEGGYTLKLPEREEMFVYDAAMRYMRKGVPLIVLAGKEYGAGSSRDWAAKGTYLFGIKSVIAESFERIHRSNLIGMGVLPLTFKEGENLEKLGLDGSEEFYIYGLKNIAPRKELTVKAVKEKGETIEFNVITKFDTDMEVEYFKNKGILPFVLRKLAKSELTES